MDSSLSDMDWALVRAFLAVAETGSLSAGARRLGTSQPTMGRQIKELEMLLGVPLFQRHPKGLRLTETGETLLEPAHRMRDAMRQIALNAAGRDTRLHGTIRITSSLFMSQYVLPPILARLRTLEPEIRIDLVPSDTSENLLYREADIAVRMYRPTQLDIVARKLGEMKMGVFAARSYLDRAGRPGQPEDLLRHDLIGYDRNELIVKTMRQMGWPAHRDWFTTRCDNQTVYWALVRAGCGIGSCQADVARADPEIEEVLPDMDIPSLPVWLAAHEELYHTPRIKRVWRILAEGLDPLVS